MVSETRVSTYLLRLRQPEDCLRIGYVGRFVEEKGLPILLQAARKLKEHGVCFRLTLIGDGDIREKLESEVDRLGIRDRVTIQGLPYGAALEAALRGNSSHRDDFTK